MAKLQTENLFLLEFLVDDLKMDSRCDCVNPGEICVSFQFLDNEPLDVCEGDFNGGKKFGENATSKTGKSVLFSLTPTQAQNVSTGFDLTVNIFKKLQSGCQTEKTCVGTARIPILSIFLDLFTDQETSAVAKVLQDTFPVVNCQGMTVGKIAVYIRLSCYGKMIITQFQMNMDDKSVLFKDKDGQSLYRYKKAKKGRATKIEDLSQKNEPQTNPQMNPQMNQQMMFGQAPYYAASNYPMQPPQNASMMPPPNPNCPMQSCFPSNYGGGQQQGRSGCGGGCGR